MGFSIVGYEGDGIAGHEIPHHLGRKPELTIFKNRDTASHWVTYFEGIGSDAYIALNQTNERQLGVPGIFGAVSDETFELTKAGSPVVHNDDGYDIISYHFTSSPGVSKIGKYIGTDAVGNYVDCGFKPGWVMIKNLTTASSWVIIDAGRGDKDLYPDLSNAEVSTNNINFVESGIEIIGAGTLLNDLNDEYLFMAFAETATDANKAWTDYEYPTNADTISIAENSVLSFADGFDAVNGQIDYKEYVGSGITFQIPAGNEDERLWVYKDWTGSYGVTSVRPLEGWKTRDDADKWGVVSPLDVTLRTTAKHFGYESETGVVLASGEFSTNAAWNAFSKIGEPYAGSISNWIIDTTTLSWLQYKATEKRILKSWRFRESASTDRLPVRFTIEGSNDGLNWTAIDSSYTASDYTGNGGGLWGDLQDVSANTVAYLYHRINITLNGGAVTYTAIQEMEFNTILPADYYLVEPGVMYGRGEDRVVNGDFATDTDWIKGDGWSIAGGVASCDGSQSASSLLYEGGIAVDGAINEVTFTVSNYSAGGLQAYVGNEQYGGVTVSANGTYSYHQTANNENIIFKADADFIGDIDNVSLIDPNTPIERIYLAEVQMNSDNEVIWYENLPVAKGKFGDVEVHGVLKAHGDILNLGVASAWVVFNGVVNPPQITSSYNVKDVVDLGAGYYKVIYVSLDNKEYAAHISANQYEVLLVGVDSTTKDHIELATTVSDGTLTDSALVTLTVFGGKEIK